MKHIIRWAIPVLILLTGWPHTTAGEPAGTPPETALRITIIYDNYLARSDMYQDWGFSCLVEFGGQSLLFDAGNNVSLFKQNMQTLELAPKDFPDMFISHFHGDHTAGMPWICKENPSVNCHLPSTWYQELKDSGKLPPHSHGYDRPTHILGPFYSTGDHFTAFHEQGLVVKTESGGVLITGCGHPGPVHMIRLAEKELDMDIHTLIGGLHLMRMSDTQLKDLSDELKALGIERICPTHCTGEHAIAYLKSSFGEGYMEGGAGQVLILE